MPFLTRKVSKKCIKSTLKWLFSDLENGPKVGGGIAGRALLAPYQHPNKVQFVIIKMPSRMLRITPQRNDAKWIIQSSTVLRINPQPCEAEWIIQPSTISQAFALWALKFRPQWEILTLVRDASYWNLNNKNKRARTFVLGKHTISRCILMYKKNRALHNDYISIEWQITQSIKVHTTFISGSHYQEYLDLTSICPSVCFFIQSVPYNP